MKTNEEIGCEVEAMLEAKSARRNRHDDKMNAKLVLREDAAESMVGTLIRDGKTISYVMPGGRYREGGRLDLIAFLIRNNYV